MKAQVVKFRHYIETWESEIEITVLAKVTNQGDLYDFASCEIISIRNDSCDPVTIDELKWIDPSIEKDLVEYAFEAYQEFLNGLDEDDKMVFGTAV